jgi:hypothetical protein
MRPTGRPTGPAATDPTDGSAYPRLDPDTTAAVAGKLVDIVTLLHAEGLTEEQLGEVRVGVAAQLAAAERLHRFPLDNSQEPIFVAGAPFGGRA